MDYLMKFIQKSLLKAEFLWTKSTQIQKQSKHLKHFHKKPSEQLFFQLKYRQLHQEQVEQYQKIIRTKQKIEAENPLRNKMYPEENFIDAFYSSQKEGFFDNNKYKLHTYRFKAFEQPPKAICVIFHGMNWHSNLLAHIAEDLAKNQIEVCAYDFKGYGKSQGLRGYMPDIKRHIEDAHQFIAEVQKIYPDKPLFLCGFSLGGLTAFHLGLENREKFKGIVFFAPALKDHPYYQRYPKIFGRFIGRLFPKMKVTPTNKGRSSAQRNKVVDDYLFKVDELYYKEGLRAGTIRSIIESMMDTEFLYHDFDVPFLLFQGGHDKLVDPSLASQLIEQSPSQDKQIIYDHNLWHGIPLEPEIDEYMKIVVDWIHKRV
ncbi:alpha/beta fold hydrolase (macronuclear) [Tetrahymena thermophila SB210]|uniref:Alpha/beta fold hydrolase n=1 Tax=Tetrahymena thermophila (strain SB210) TaxID=312017 RepID=Q22SU1_TETTS|nr:alpha/beta fold hydrolase [Tetrahymena thermophila SB210]EAR88373.1 alpha/beta fold hydrolase [Tetrahymena thermophila SB210]|eukprot:XP_001008618.1 alpha/beta fold hydrolase [Tetrahymena thermophila SB210]